MTKFKATCLIRATNDETAKILDDITKATGESNRSKALIEAARYYLNDRKRDQERIEKLMDEKHQLWQELGEIKESVQLFTRSLNILTEKSK